MVEIAGLDRMLLEHPFFAGMAPEQAAFVAGCGRNVVVEAGAWLFREGEAADQFYLLRHGRVTLELRAPGREPLIFDTLGEGDIVGWSWLLPPFCWSMDARAQTLVRVVALDAHCLRDKLDSDPALGYALLRRFVPVMGRRLQAAHLQLADLYARPQGGRG